jgi:cytochrome c-type biogenesis protein CcsB
MTNELSVLLLRIATWIYIGAAVCYLAYFLSTRRVLGQAGMALFVAGIVPHIAALAVRTIVSQRPPFLNLYEYMMSVTLGMVIMYLALEYLTRTKVFGAVAVPLIALASLFTTGLPSEVAWTMPALKSAWRVPHIATAILAYSAFAIAFGLGVLYLVRESFGSGNTGFWATRLPTLKELDHTAYRMIAFGFTMQTALLLTGAIWAQYVFGRPWSWDPKEVWALVTWLVYAAYLHTRLSMGWRGRKSVLLAIIGFVVVLFTLFGVNWIGRGYHSEYS